MRRKPLVMDLDGTLFPVDTAWENLRMIFFQKPTKIPELMLHLLRGRADLKCWLQAEAGLEVESLPLREELVQIIRREKKKGRPVCLVSGAPQAVVNQTSRRLGLQDKEGHLGSSPGANLTPAKKSFLLKKFGMRGYDYFGDRATDLAVFHGADRGAVVGARPGMVRRALRANPKLEVISPLPSFQVSAWKGLRTHQWIKNLLLLVPLFSAHAWNQPAKWGLAIGAMATFSFLSSAVYLLNDLHDLEADRRHPQKRTRPLAHGDLKIPEALLLAILLLVFALAAGWWLGTAFFFYALAYLVVAVAYNFWAKSKAGLDLIGLASFYTLRILAGGAAEEIVCSPWLLGYAIFLFLSLACVKRVSELYRLKGEKKLRAEGRGYGVGDLEAISAIGISSGVVSVLVAALYVNSPDVRILYVQPQLLWLLCPIFFYWVIRIWLKTLRGEMPEDPVLFALKDRGSWILLFLALAIGAAASR